MPGTCGKRVDDLRLRRSKKIARSGGAAPTRRVPVKWVATILCSALTVVPLTPGSAHPIDTSYATQAPEQENLKLAIPPGRTLQKSSQQANNNYLDPIGDAGQAMDVERVSISDDAQGNLVIDADVPTRPFMGVEDRLLVIIDSDANPNTGDTRFMGAEYYFDALGDGFDSNSDGVGDSPGASLFRYDGFNYQEVDPPPFTWDAATGATFQVNRAALGNTQVFNFYVFTEKPYRAEQPNFDIAPEVDPVTDASQTWRFPDLLPPQVEATRSSALSAKSNQFVYTVRDQSGYAEVLLNIFRVGRSSPTVAPQLFPYQRTNGVGEEFVFNWLVPKSITGYQEFCVDASDGAGNRSGPVCRRIMFQRISTRTDVLRSISDNGITVLKLSLGGLPKGTLGTVECTRKCKLSERQRVDRKFTSKRFKDRFLKDGSVVVVKVTKPRLIGYFEKLTVAGKRLKRVKKCLPPGLRKPARCP